MVSRFAELLTPFHHLPVIGGDEENRTPDPLLAKQVLSQLSYTPISRRQSLRHFYSLVKIHC